MKSPFIDAALLVGIFATCIQAADFLIRPTQKQRIQLFAESATLHLEEIRPLEWLKFFKNTKVRQLLYFGTVCVYQWHGIYRRWQSQQVMSHDQMVVGLVLSLIGLPLLALSYWYGPVFVGWLYADGKLTRFLERLLLLIYTTVFGLLAGIGGLIYAFSKMTDAHLDPQGVMHRLATLPPSMQIVVLVCLVYTFMVFFSETILLSTVGAVIVAAHVLLLILELVLKILRAFAWRVVEYNKGASPAILLVLTSVIGLLKLYLGQH